jgi:DNA-binding winged helix-turn-helix (wHTH) protein
MDGPVQGYEFGPFRLFPSDYLLMRGETQVHLGPKNFDVLVLLVRNSNRLVKKAEFLDRIWDGAETYEKSITISITHIRHALDHDNWRKPTYIKTVAKQGYRFIAPVTPIPYKDVEIDRETDAEQHPTVIDKRQKKATSKGVGRSSFRVESHKFVPVFLGEAAKELVNAGSDKVNEWAAYSEIKYKGKRLCIFPFEVGVWHIIESVRFTSITDLAIWRRQTYEAINKAGTHPIISLTNKLLANLPRTRVKGLREIYGRPGYVFSLFVLIEPLWDDPNELRTALRLCSCPNTLQAEDRADVTRNEAIQLERDLLREDFQSTDVREFGLTGVDIGYASWSGLSYYSLKGGRGRLAPNIVEFELAVQALWWFSHCIKTLGESPSEREAELLARAAQIITKQFSKLKAIGPTEPMQQRTMVEAVLETSRLEKLVEDTMALLRSRRS